MGAAILHRWSTNWRDSVERGLAARGARDVLGDDSALAHQKLPLT
jgi:hypothetical protein